jgi:hypothetical protein
MQIWPSSVGALHQWLFSRRGQEARVAGLLAAELGDLSLGSATLVAFPSLHLRSMGVSELPLKRSLPSLSTPGSPMDCVDLSASLCGNPADRFTLAKEELNLHYDITSSIYVHRYTREAPTYLIRPFLLLHRAWRGLYVRVVHHADRTSWAAWSRASWHWSRPEFPTTR